MTAVALPATYPPASGVLRVLREAMMPPRQPRLLNRVRDAVRARHYSRRTEKAYVAWTRRYILFHGKRHPSGTGAAELTQYLSALATQNNVSAPRARSVALHGFQILIVRSLYAQFASAGNYDLAIGWRKYRKRCTGGNIPC